MLASSYSSYYEIEFIMKKKEVELLNISDLEEVLPAWGDNKEPTPQRKLFAKLYTTKGITFCNATESYAAAYDYDIEPRVNEETGKLERTPEQESYYLTCRVNGSRLRANAGVKTMIDNELMAQFNDRNADVRLQEILIGGKDADSLNAIKQYNELKGRIVKKMDVNVAARPFQQLSDDELNAMANE